MLGTNPVSVNMQPKVFNQDRNTPRTMFFAAYTGPSMNPTLREPEMMEVVPYDNRPLRVGDVIFFVPPQNEQPVVHRIVRVIPAGISTRGDNNVEEDRFLLQPPDIKGQVVAVWRGQKRREIAGGLPGQWISRWRHWLRIPDNGVSYLLHPLYSALSRRGLIAKWLPTPFRPRIIVFQTQGQDQYRLLLGKHIIGRYDEEKRQWQIQRPFRLLVDERALPKSAG
ncbi:signal peptidase I [Gammaproteobacteria bacterium]